MFEEILIDQNPHWRVLPNVPGIKREKFLKLVEYLPIPQSIAIMGIRRCGKSILLKQLIYYLLNDYNVPRENVLFLNLEQPYLLKYSQDINNLENMFLEYMQLKNPNGQLYILLDEIQFFTNWPLFVKAHYEKQNVKFIITGSNSALLSSDLITLLSGRALPLELYPLSFKEIILDSGIDYKDKSEIIVEKGKIQNILTQMLNRGGFPEIRFIQEKSLACDILSNYAKTIVLQDIAPRLNIRKPYQLEELFMYLITNISCTTSYNKLSSYFSLSDKSIKEYIAAFRAAYLLFEVEKFSYSIKPQLKTIKKIYSIDCGLANACGFKFTHNNGKLLENLIFIDCQQRGLEIFFYKTNNNLEVDFIVKTKHEIFPLQVCWELNEGKTFLRETKALTTAMDELKLNKGYLLTMENNINFNLEDKRIIHIPAWKWLLN
jgi:predicted AAA+ superfamily ATPase